MMNQEDFEKLHKLIDDLQMFVRSQDPNFIKRVIDRPRKEHYCNKYDIEVGRQMIIHEDNGEFDIYNVHYCCWCGENI